MSYKLILCVLGGSSGEINTLRTAQALAKIHNAKIHVLHTSDNTKPYTEILVKKARFTSIAENTDDLIAEYGCLSDLVILSHDYSTKYDLVTPALFDTGRPVLLIRPPQDEKLNTWKGKTVSFAWNGSIESSRALHAAIPFMKHADKNFIIIRDDSAESADEPILDEFLDAHGITTKKVMINSCDVGDGILMQALKLKSDLLVMGAYGHSMIKEMLVGGVTEHMLSKADLALLMAH